MTEPRSLKQQRRIAELVKQACVRAAREGYERAATSGLCEEGALEAAISAIQMLDPAAIIDGESDGD